MKNFIKIFNDWLAEHREIRKQKGIQKEIEYRATLADSIFQIKEIGQQVWLVCDDFPCCPIKYFEGIKTTEDCVKLLDKLRKDYMLRITYMIKNDK